MASALAIALTACSSSPPPTPSPTTSRTPNPTSDPTSAPATTTSGSTGPDSTRPRGTEPPAPTGTTGTAPRTTPPRSDAKITSFEAPASVACNGLVKITVTARYTTTGAASVAFLVDNEQVAGTPPVNGSFELPMRCDGSTHTIVISAIDGQGRAAVMSKAVLTDDRESGG